MEKKLKDLQAGEKALHDARQILVDAISATEDLGTHNLLQAPFRDIDMSLFTIGQTILGQQKLIDHAAKIDEAPPAVS
ncbi:hypothetical protein [Burkholderia phage BCSR129]|nr:hypothetical protein [Burkholderia phage BCSR129]